MSNSKLSAEARSTRTAGALAASPSKARPFASLASLLRRRGSGAPSFRRLTAPLLAACALLLAAAPAGAVTLDNFDVNFQNAAGEQPMGAGEHPAAMVTTFEVKKKIEAGKVYPLEALKDLDVAQVEGLAGNVAAVPPCTTADFLKSGGGCPDSSALGYVRAELGEAGQAFDFTPALYSLYPAPGYVARLGFVVSGVRVTIDVGVSEAPPYRIEATLRNISQALEVFGTEVVLWGTPAATEHDAYRGSCLNLTPGSEGELLSKGKCKAGITAVPFLTNPRACEGPLETLWQVTSWQNPGLEESGGALTHGDSGDSRGFGGCGGLPFTPSISAQPTAKAATSPTGLDFDLDVADPGYTDPPGLAGADIERAEVTLPEGMSVNPSQAEGLAVCSEDQLARESSKSEFGAGCPAASKVGSIEVESPALPEKLLKGSLFVAKPYENLADDSLIALYIVIKDPELGISAIQPARVESDPVTGRLTTTTEDMPQLPFSHFRLHFKEGARSPLVTPPACGSYDVAAKLYPYSGGSPVTSTSSFQVISGPDNSPCPSGGLPPFHPALTAGTENNAAGAFSPFLVKLTRTDSEQEFTNFSIKLPPGIAGKLAGIPFCSDAAIAAAAARTGPHGGQEELNAPSCPAASYVGRTLAGAGVGPSLAYAPGKIYLAGPYHGKPLSMVAITAGVVGPFDIGTVVVRLAIDVNPETGEVFLDSTGSDPIPHIIQGIPVHLRDVRAYTDRPEFTFNPTSCEPTSTAATVLGSGLDFVSPADDNPFVSTSPFQAADCASLGFKPKLDLKLKGRDQARRQPGPAGDPDPAGRRCQLQEHLGPAAALGVPRPGPHPHRLHPGPVQRRRRQRRRLPGGLGLRPRPGLDPDPLRTAGRPDLPALLRTPAAGPGPGAARADRLQRGRPHRLGQGRNPQHLRFRPRRPDHQSRGQLPGRQEGPAGKLHQPLQVKEPGQGQVQGPQRQDPQRQAGAAGEVQEAQEEAQAGQGAQAPCPRGALGDGGTRPYETASYPGRAGGGHGGLLRRCAEARQRPRRARGQGRWSEACSSLSPSRPSRCT